jgi:translation initiation factor 3 subunit I
MRPFLLSGHSRPVTHIVYAADGDVFWSAGKDGVINLWSATNGSRLGTYDAPDAARQAAVNALDVDQHTKTLLSAGSDGRLKVWDPSSGVLRASINASSPLVHCALSDDGKSFFGLAMAAYGKAPFLVVGDLRKAEVVSQKFLDVRASAGFFTGLNTAIVLMDDIGAIRKLDAETLEPIGTVSAAHEQAIVSCAYARDRSCFVTASHDGSAKLWDTESLEKVRVFETDVPLNCVDLSHDKQRVIGAGGQQAAQVTTTGNTSAQFELRLWSAARGEELGRIPGHFGPVNAVAMSPSGTGFTSGAEDGTIRLHHWDEQYAQLD